jgi:phosphatidylglycerophosphatase GEP4
LLAILRARYLTPEKSRYTVSIFTPERRSFLSLYKAESVTYHLGVPVLRHSSPKPSYSCIATIRKYFASLRSPLRDDELIIVGDRILTDVVLANRMHDPLRTSAAGSHEKNESQPLRRGPLAIWTTGVWEREGMVIRWWERRLLWAVDRWVLQTADRDSGWKSFIKDT